MAAGYPGTGKANKHDHPASPRRRLAAPLVAHYDGDAGFCGNLADGTGR
jgi:hypothetical protein